MSLDKAPVQRVSKKHLPQAEDAFSLDDQYPKSLSIKFATY
jgi:hypothetical protein